MLQGCFFVHYSLATLITSIEPKFSQVLSRNFHRYWAEIFTGLLLYACWDTPGENTGLWQLPNVSSAFNILQDKIVFGFLMKKHKSWDFFTVVVILRSKVLNILKTILETWQSVWIIFHVLPVNTRKRYQLIMFHQLPLACFITQIEKKKRKKKRLVVKGTGHYW